MPISIRTVSLPVSRGLLHHIPTSLVLCNDIALPEERPSSEISLWIAWQGFGPTKEYLGAAWGKSGPLALAALFLHDIVKKNDIEGRNVTIKKVDFVPTRDWTILCLFAEARGAKAKTLDGV
jgi:hypothetical protein